MSPTDPNQAEFKSLLTEEVLRAAEERFSATDLDRGGMLSRAAEATPSAAPPVLQNPPGKVIRRLQHMGVSAIDAQRAVQLMSRKDRSGGGIRATIGAVPEEAIPDGMPADARIGLERILGKNELMNARFLAVGAARAQAVARIEIRSSTGATRGFGTGFLVSSRLLLTNNHVLGDEEVAKTSVAQFGYESGFDGSPFEAIEFHLQPDVFFITDRDLDFTIVAVEPTSADGTSTSHYGYIPMVDSDDDILVKETVNIIQHPNGERKQVALRENEVIDTADTGFLLYRTDTAPGSSGSCVLNDQWELVALHHAGKARRNEAGQVMTRDGRVWDPRTMPESEIDWIANEGVRIPAIIEFLRFHVSSESEDALLDDALTHSSHPPKDGLDPRDRPGSGPAPGTGSPDAPPAGSADSGTICPPRDGVATVIVPLEITVRALSPGSWKSPGAPDTPPELKGISAYDPSVPEQEAVSIDPDYRNRKGYDSKFLGKGAFKVSLPWLSSANYAQVAFNRQAGSGKRHVLTYHHYSVVMNRLRRLAFFTAVNIDGTLKQTIRRETDNWFMDPRIGLNEQVGNELYRGNPLDRGHLVRRLDPAWGSSPAIAKIANDDTFHYTNCAPQHERFNRNRQTWQGIENYILNNAKNHGLKVSVFTGPVFRNSDRLHRGIQVPRDFWKIVVMRRKKRLSATAYLLSQEDLLVDLPREVTPLEEDFVFGDYKLRQVPIWRIEDLTGLSFRRLRSFDPKNEEAAFERSTLEGVEELTDLSQIVL